MPVVVDSVELRFAPVVASQIVYLKSVQRTSTHHAVSHFSFYSYSFVLVP